MTEHLFKSFQEFIHKYHLIERGNRIIISVSGGLDSMVLLDLMCELKKRMKLEIAIAHFNHQLRGQESDEDEAFVRAAAKEHSLICYVECGDTEHIAGSEKLSIQETARNLRYNFFNQLRRSHGYQKIATAHNLDDNAETLFLNLIRGSGVHGLTGIPVERRDQLIIRPLLFATREQIRLYADNHNIQFREDTSNLKDDYTRNFVRLKLLPLIREHINPNLNITITRTTELFNQLEDYLDSQLKPILINIVKSRGENEISLNLTLLKEQPIYLQEQMLLQLGREISSSDVEFGTVKTMMNLSNAETGSYCSIAKDVVLHRDRQHLIFKRISPATTFSYGIELNKKYKFDTFNFEIKKVQKANLSNNPYIEYIDGDTLGKQLIIRSWHEGDWFIPFGMRVKKKISDFFIDRKIPLFEKQFIPILLSDSNIVWICGKRLDDRFKIKSTTKSIYKLEIKPVNIHHQ